MAGRSFKGRTGSAMGFNCSLWRSSMEGFLRSVWLWLCATVYHHPVPRVGAWQGATPGWSPKAAVSAVERTAAWDVGGWYTDGQTDLHRTLDRVEHNLRSDLDDILATVYAWRDAEMMV